MDDLIRDYAPNLVEFFNKFPEIKVASMQGDGKIYGMPISQLNGWIAAYALSINKSWLDYLNLKTPETTEELYQVLKAFKERDPNQIKRHFFASQRFRERKCFCILLIWQDGQNKEDSDA